MSPVINTYKHREDKEEKKHFNLHIVQQTKLAGVGYLLLFGSSILVYMTSDNRIKGRVLANIISMLIIIPVSLYAVNCSVVGGCNLYAWIMSYIVVTYGVLLLLLILFSILK
jgi:hypothetical protein